MTDHVCHKLALEQIHPKGGAKFSPNLYQWMRKHAHFYADGAGTPHGVWRVKPGMGRDIYHEGSLMLGMAGDHGDFLGTRLMSVLCEGAKATNWCLPGLLDRLEPVEDFWDRYVQVGRCAIDPDHSIHYIDDRWHQNSTDKRTCRWCSHEQNRHLLSEIVEREAWV